MPVTHALETLLVDLYREHARLACFLLFGIQVYFLVQVFFALERMQFCSCKLKVSCTRACMKLHQNLTQETCVSTGLLSVCQRYCCAKNGVIDKFVPYCS